jgi:hypothetical protein
MATVLDLGLLQTFDVIFPFMLVWALVFAILMKTTIVGKAPAINALIATVAAFTVILSRTVVELINFIIPWFTVAIIFFILLLLIFMIFGAKESDILGALKHDKAIIWVVIGVAIVIFIAGGATVLGPKLVEGQSAVNPSIDGEVASGTFESNIYDIIFNPKILGLMILFGIAIFAVALLTGQ